MHHIEQSSMCYTIGPCLLSILNIAVCTWPSQSTNNKCWRGCGKKGTHLHCWWECKLVQPLWRTVWRFLKKLEIELPYDTDLPLPGIYHLMFFHLSLLSCPCFLSCSFICPLFLSCPFRTTLRISGEKHDPKRYMNPNVHCSTVYIATIWAM